MPDTVLVLGAGSAIARSLASRLLHHRTAKLILAARRPAELEPWMDELRSACHELQVCPLTFDASDVDSHRGFVDEIWNDAHRVDLVLFAFGIMGNEESADRRADALRVASTNYLGAVSLLRLVADRLTAQGQGRIVVLSSAAARLPRPGQAAYASSKAGLDSFAQGLALELHGCGVAMTIVRPGFVHTPMTRGMRPPRFATTADEVAQDTVRGLERGAGVVWSPPAVRWMTTAAAVLPVAIYRRIIATRGARTRA
jgi:decaprenylphospho-beta-D-erythro-pentofuranosid-2-ulose 2-reductase